MSGDEGSPEEVRGRDPSRAKGDDGEDANHVPPAAGGGKASDSELRERGNHQAFLVEVNEILAAASDVEAALEKIVIRLRERNRLTSASFFLLEATEPALRCVVRSALQEARDHPKMDLNGGGLIPWVARMAEPAYVPDVDRDPQQSPRDPTIKSEFAAPLCAGSNVIGVLHVESDRLDGIRAVTRKLVEQCAFQVAFAVERSELARRLQSSEERFRTIFEQGHLGVALLHLDGKLSVANLGLAHMLGFEAMDFRDKHYADLVHPEDREKGEENFRLMLEGKLPRLTVEVRLLRKSGDPLWCQVAFSLLRDAAGNPNFALAIIQDISDKKRSELEREELREQLLHSQKMEAIGTLAGGVAHDFNNVLGVILGFASLLRLRLSSEDPVYEPIRMIEQSAERAAGLTRQLLSFAQRGKYQPQAVAIEEILERVVRIATETFDRRIRVETRFASDPCFVKGDPGQLEQAFLNLCINARDAMPEGGTLTLNADLVTLREGEPALPPQSPTGPYVCTVIKDTGSGIAPHVLERIFEPFFTTKGPGKGTGLGLAVVYGIVNNHGGFIRVASEVGRGSEFAVYLPLMSRHQVRVESKSREAIEPGVGTVLVVDDEPLILAFAEEGLSALGYRVVKAEDGARAYEIYSQRAAEIDFVLMDIVLPGMSGIDAARKLHEINPRVKIILSSGYSGRGKAQEILDAGVVDFIGKPYTVEMLSRVLSRARQEATRSAP
jgi:two-component system, cell cycle sensor histidine kinase and response regulator CckA